MNVEVAEILADAITTGSFYIGVGIAVSHAVAKLFG